MDIDKLWYESWKETIESLWKEEAIGKLCEAHLDIKMVLLTKEWMHFQEIRKIKDKI